MAERLQYTRDQISSEKQLRNEMLKVSKANPEKIIVHYVGFSNTAIYILDRQPTTDTLESVSTYKFLGGFLKNGNIISPTKTWMNKHNHIPCRD